MELEEGTIKSILSPIRCTLFITTFPCRQPTELILCFFVLFHKFSNFTPSDRASVLSNEFVCSRISAHPERSLKNGAIRSAAGVRAIVNFCL